MRWQCCCLLLATGLLLAADESKKDPTEEDMKLIQGTWELVGREKSGVDNLANLKGLLLVIEKDSLSFRNGKETFGEETFRLDATKAPKELTTTTKGGSVTFGLYRILSKDAFTIGNPSSSQHQTWHRLIGAMSDQRVFQVLEHRTSLPS